MLTKLRLCIIGVILLTEILNARFDDRKNFECTLININDLWVMFACTVYMHMEQDSENIIKLLVMRFIFCYSRQFVQTLTDSRV